jgi:SNF2 family DNA or RNA helicase
MAYVAIPLNEIPNFPEQTLDVVHVDLEKRDRAEINNCYKEMSERMKARGKSVLAEMGKCRERVEFAKTDAIAELTLSHLSENKSVVIFCNFTSARERIGRFLASNGIEYGEVYGGQKEEERQLAIDRFQANELHVMIVMTAAGGAALSLHDTKHERPRVSLITPSFNAAEVRQALGRIRRCNGTNVEQYFVLAAKTIEDQVSRKLEAKLNNIDTLNDNDLIA